MNHIESPVAAVQRVLVRETGSMPSTKLTMLLIEAVRETTPPPREVTVSMLTKILQSLTPSEALTAWADRSSREIVKLLARQPTVQKVAKLVNDERLWCTLEGTIAGMLLRVCCGQDLETPDTHAKTTEVLDTQNLTTRVELRVDPKLPPEAKEIITTEFQRLFSTLQSPTSK